MSSLPAPATPAEAAQLIADALNAAKQAGFDPYWDREEGHMCCSRSTGATFEYADVYQDHQGTWRVNDPANPDA